MKNAAIIGILLSFLLSISACGADGEQHFTVTEIGAYDFAEAPSQFVLIGLQPCVLVGGNAYIYESDSWNKICVDKKLTEIYAGEVLCVLTEDGSIEVWSDVEGEFASDLQDITYTDNALVISMGWDREYHYYPFETIDFDRYVYVKY